MLLRTDTFKLVTLPVLLATVVLGGCAGSTAVQAPQPPPARVEARQRLSLGDAIAELAMGMVGARYHYGGASPEDGFDCSGLVFYAYSQAGLEIPRTSQEQFRAAHKIALAQANAGDVIFFQDQAKLSHIGIYVGDGLFVHAPSTGQRVAIANLESPYFHRHLVAVGRLLPN
jgi:cell wall-associated NlpC family hydrolase